MAEPAPHPKEHDDHQDQWPEDEWLQNDQHRQATLHGVCYTAWALRQKLVPDLVPTILNDLDLVTFTAHHTYDPEVAISEHTAPQQILVTPPIQSLVKSAHPVRKITFELESHDQGTCSYPDAGNWTWFSARIIRKGTDPPPEMESSTQTVAAPRLRRGIHPAHPRRARRILPFTTASAESRVPADDETDRELFKNRLAAHEWYRQSVTWSADADDEKEVEWVKGLQMGDRIGIIAWARFPGWYNHVKYVGVTLSTVALSR